MNVQLRYRCSRLKWVQSNAAFILIFAVCLATIARESANPSDQLERERQCATRSEKGVTATIHGRVLLPDGKPASGAHLAVLGNRTEVARGGDRRQGREIMAEATADEKGEYAVRLRDVSQKTHAYPRLIARQDGSAIAWRELNLDATETEADFELKPEEPIRGKLVDIEGQPAAGVRLSIVSVVERTENELQAERARCSSSDRASAAWIAPIVADDQGRFVVHGLAADQGVMLEVQGDDRFALQDIAVNTGMPEERGEYGGYRPLVKNVKPGEEVVLPLSPAQIFEGTVRYADSGEPAPHARLTILASQEESGSSMSVAGSADEHGHYHISPRPGIRFGVTAHPPAGVPYLARQTSKEIHWKGGERVKEVDLTLSRGVLVRGTVVEVGTATGVAGATVRYTPESSNNRNATNDIRTDSEVSDEDGRFAIAVLPGPGRLLVTGPQGKYVLREIGDRELHLGKPGGRRQYVHALAKLDPKAGQDAVEVKLELQPGAAVNGRIVDEAGTAIDEALVILRVDFRSWRGAPAPTLGGRFELAGLAEGVEYLVYFLDPKRRLGATEVIKAGDKERTVVLKPCGKATLRLIDADGEPMPANYGLLQMVVTPGPYDTDRDAIERGELVADAAFIQNIDRANNPLLRGDENGARAMNSLIPGATYRVVAKRDGQIRIVKEFQVKPNETVDFGDIVVER
jgi:hypothetical protein